MKNRPAQIIPLAVWWAAMQIDLQVYLLEGEALGLVDTAGPGASLVEALAAEGRAPGEVSLVLNTHAHADHAGGNHTVKARGGGRLCIHKDDAPFLEDPGLCFDRFFGPRTRMLRGDEAAAAERAAYIEGMGGGLAADRLLEDGDLLDLGGSLEIRVIHLPGHTPGSVGFFWEKEGILIAGDSVAGLGTPEGSLPLIFDLVAYQGSIARLLEIPVARLYTSHPYRGLRVTTATMREGADVRTYLEDSREMAARLTEAFEAQAGQPTDRPLLEVADAVVDVLPPEMGHRRIAELPFADFTATTVLWGTRRSEDTR
ncbi:MAG: MBL fold metallo-hydrolase [Thermoleophilia bacterium]|nr:MBL fold metallo-hydrolase [Thermoleophilia bacterium]